LQKRRGIQMIKRTTILMASVCLAMAAFARAGEEPPANRWVKINETPL
jgi:hypothetical protein